MAVSPSSVARLREDGEEIGTAPGDRAFRPDVQGLRALAVLLVLAFHAKLRLASGGFVGVDVFFVISGFVITGLLLRERAATRATSFLGFYARRVRRILPAATLVLVATVVATYVLEGVLRGRDVAVDGLWSSVFLSNLHFAAVHNDYLGAQGTPSPLLNYWSLAVEEQFYVAFPLLFAGTAVLTVRRWGHRGVAGLLGLVALASFALAVAQASSSPITAFYSPLTRAWELALGGLVAVAAPQLRRLPEPVAAVLTWVGLAGIGIAAVSVTASTPWPGTAALLPVVGAALVIAGGTVAPRRGAELVLGSRPGLALGALSFSLYLWHYPILTLAQQQSARPLTWPERILLLLLSLVLAVVTTRLIEDPIRHSARLRGRPGGSLGIGALLVASSVALCGVLIWANPLPGSSVRPPGPSSASEGIVMQDVATAAQAERAPAILVPAFATLHSSVLRDPSIPSSCVDRVLAMTSGPLCALGDPSGTRSVVLLGDSQAMMWSTSFLDLARAQHWRLFLIGRDGCPPWRTTEGAGGHSASCSAFHAWSRRRIARLHPSMVVVTGAPTVGASASADERGAQHLLVSLRPTAARVVVLGPVPWFAGRWTGLAPAECVAEQPDHLSGCNLPVATLDASFGPFGRALEVAGHRTGAPVVDLRRLFCTTATCPVIVNHRLVYHDPWHISLPWARYVAPAVGSLLVQAIAASSAG